jgi:hypothetical protein
MTMGEILILAFFGLLGLAVLFLLWPSGVRLLIGLARNVCLGLGLFWLAGQLFGEAYIVRLNVVTGAVTALFGVPGSVLLLLCRHLL